MPQSNAHQHLAALLPRVLLALCLMLHGLAPVWADTGERWGGMRHSAFKRHVHPDLSSGLCFVQDRQGFIWIGTQSGLTRWDGNRHLRYSAETRADALPDNYIMSLHIDRQGQLWIGMNSGGLARYDPEHDNFVRYHASNDRAHDPRVAAITDDGEGGLWLATGSGLDHLASNGQFDRRAERYGAAALPEGGIDTLLHDASGALWAGTGSGLFLLSEGQRPQPITLGGKRGIGVEALLRDSSGQLWIGSRNHGAYLLASGDNNASALRESGPQPTLQNEKVAAIVEAAPGEIWFGTNGANGGIVVLELAHRSTHRIRHRADTPDSLADNDIMAMFRERSGIMYVADMVGISQHTPQPGAVLTVRHLAPERAGILSVPGLMEAPDRRLWLSLVSGNVEILDPVQGVSGHLDSRNGLPPGRVLAIAAGPDGEVYLGTQHGLFRAGADGRQAHRVALPQRRDDEEVWTLTLVGRTLWLGGQDGLWGLHLPPQGAPQLLRHEAKTLGDPRVTAILADGDALWVGTRTGLARVGPHGVEVIPADLGAPDRLPPGYVSSLLLDREGRLWLSNFGTGVVLLERTDSDGRRRFRRLGMQQGLPDSGANKLLQDRAGMLWASTDAGLARIDPRSLEVRALGPGEGVNISTYWTNAGIVTSAGELVFGGLSGLTVLRPQALEPWRYVPPVVVTQIQLNDQEIPVGPYNAGLGARAKPIRVSTAARERGFSVEFAALDYSTPERNRYAYQLKGFDPHWIDSEASLRRASYNNLPPGDYVLQLRGSNRDGTWAPPLEVPVQVQPVWHQRPLARLALGMLAVLLLTALMQVRTAYLRRRQRELEAMVETRTAELRATQAQLETLAYADALTGLANRRLFNDQLRHLVAQAERGAPPFTLLLIDLDRFKPVNDSLGHDAGDTLLVATAERLRSAVREADQPFRLGGDEFAVLLSQTGTGELLEPVCARILQQLALPLPHGDTVIEISASVGAAIYRPGDNHEQLYKRADVALYQAKAAGRSTWRLAA